MANPGILDHLDTGASPDYVPLTSRELLYPKSGLWYYMGHDGVEHVLQGVPTSRLLTAGSGLSGGGDLSADRTFDVNVDGVGIEIVTDILQLKDGGVTAAKQASIAQGLIRGRAAGAGTGVVQDLTAAQVKAAIAIVPGDVTGFDTQVRTSRLDQMAAPTADVSINTHKLTAVVDGTVATDAATFGQLTAAIEGKKIKDPVACATTGAITLSGEQTLDGFLTSASRVLVKNQAAPETNGLYLSAAGAWARTVDANTATEISNASVLVQNGTVSKGDIYTSNSVTTLGTDPVNWTQTGEGNTVYGADGTSLQLIGSTFSEKDGGTTLAKLADLVQDSIIGRAHLAGTGVPQSLSAAQVKAILALASGDISGLGSLATISNLTGPVTSVGAATTIAGPVPLTTLAQINAATILGNNTTATGNVLALTSAQIAVMLNLPISPVRDYGCKFDHRFVSDGACSTGAPTKITSATVAFVAGDLNKRITLATAGASSAVYVGTITNVDSATQVTVSPNVQTTASAKGLQVHTDDLAAWNTLVADVNAYTYGGARVTMERFGTNRSGVSADINTFTKTVTMEGIGGSYTHDTGDYTLGGGTCIAYVGASQSTNGTFGAVLTFAPTPGGQAMGGPFLRDFWIDCYNGAQNPALYGLSIASAHGAILDNFFVMDPGASGFITGVVQPGTPNALEDKGCDRMSINNYRCRALENAFIGANTAQATLTPTTVTSIGSGGLISTSATTLGLTAANAMSPAGYAWVMTSMGYPVLVNYTSGGGTTTLSGVTCSLADSINSPTAVVGSNIVQAVPNNASCFTADGDLTANTNISICNMWQLSIPLGGQFGPAAVDLRNCDSMIFNEIAINGGTPTNDGAINRIRRPGMRHNGAIVNALSAGRNNVCVDGDVGAGGVSAMGVNHLGAKLAGAVSGPNYWYRYQLGNAAPVPTEEPFSDFEWTANGGLTRDSPGPVSVATQTIAAATLTLLTGSLIPLPPQWCQAGTTLRWTIFGATTVGAAAAPVFAIRLGPLGTTADPVVFTPTLPAGAAGTIGFKLVLEMVVRVPGVPPTAVTTRCHAIIHNGNTGAVTGIINLAQVQFTGAGTAFNAQTSLPLYAHVSYTGGAGVTVAFEQVECEVVKGANP